MSKTKSKDKSKPALDSQEPEFECLERFQALEEYVYELEHGTVSQGNEVSRSDSNAAKDKSEWYRYAESMMNSEKIKAKPLDDVPFDELLNYWMKQGT